MARLPRLVRLLAASAAASLAGCFLILLWQVQEEDSLHPAKGPSLLALPAALPSARLFLVDCLALPLEGAVALLAIAGGAHESLLTALPSDRALAHGAAQRLGQLPVSLAATDCPQAGPHEPLRCEVVPPLRCEGPFGPVECGHHVLLCRAPRLKSLDLGLCGLQLRLGAEGLVRLDTRTLAAAPLTGGRSYAASRPRPAGLRVSAVVPICHGREPPPYLRETLAYFKVSGLAHVYLTEAYGGQPSPLAQALGDFVSEGFLTIQAPAFLSDSAFAGRCLATGSQKLLNDWALFHAKSWDDLLLVHDYDELFVPTVAVPLPEILASILERRDARLEDLCYLKVCPLSTFGRLSRLPLAARAGRSRAGDLPLMDGGGQGLAAVGPEGECLRGGFWNVYPKSVAVLRNTYRTGVHAHEACRAFGAYEDILEDPSKPPELQRGVLVVRREEGLVLQHFAELFEPGRNTPEDFPLRSKNASIYTERWWPLVQVEMAAWGTPGEL